MDGEAEYSMKDKKDGKTQQTNNIVLFPNLHERLVTKGLAELSNKDFKRAAQLFMQAREYDYDNYEMNMGLLVSLVEIQQYEEARRLCHELLRKGIGDYFQIMSIYLMVLLQLSEHKEMVETIELLFQENQIPFDKIEHFEKMLDFSKKVLEERKNANEWHEKNLQKRLQQEGVFEDKSDQELLDVITKLSQMNIRPFILEIQQFLQQKETHPFFKTMLLNVLKEQDYSQPIELFKFSKVISIIPTALPDVKENDYFKKVVTLLESELLHSDPSLLDMIQSLIERHQFLLYPLEVEQDVTVMAAAYHALTEEYMTGQDICEEVTAMYKTNVRKVRECITYLKEIEGISYPFI
jgi:tetratricopeptide (TPR) repeat protein